MAANVRRYFHQSGELGDVENENFVEVQDYDFSNHFHPYVGELIAQLNKKSLDGLFDIDFQNKLKQDFFKEAYGPNEVPFSYYVTYDKKQLDLTEDGPYSIYNWELLFHVPLTIAVHLSKNQRFAEARRMFHFIFDPTSTEDGGVKKPHLKFWKFLPFRERDDIQLIEDLLIKLSSTEDTKGRDRIINSINSWRNNPFQPHAIARNRFLAYQFYVVMAYLDNLIAEGDALFRRDSIESNNEAMQLYVVAANTLGPRPQKIPPKGKHKPQTYAMLRDKLDPLGNALVNMEVQFPFNITTNDNSQHAKPPKVAYNPLFGIVKTLYFCIPPNNKLLSYWDIVEDRLFKLRHCMNIEGIVRTLPLWQPPIDPGMLVKAVAAGIDVSSITGSLNQPVSLVRSPLLIRKALEICNEVRTFGNALLSALEKKEAEKLAVLRQKYELKILELAQDTKYLQWKETSSSIEALLKTRDIIFQRFRHYQLLMGKSEESINEMKAIENIEQIGELNKENFDEVYNDLVTKYDRPITLSDYPKEKISGDMVEEFATGVVSAIQSFVPFAAELGFEKLGDNLQLNNSENKELNVFMPLSNALLRHSANVDLIAKLLSLIPQFTIHGTPIGVGVATGFGGRQISTAVSAGADLLRLFSTEMNYRANRASKLAAYQRRMEDWVLHSNLAACELMQIGRQIITSVLREQVAKKDYDNQEKHIEALKVIESFLNEEKYTKEDFYAWMQGEISRIFYDCYKFAYDIAKKAEQTMKHELMRKELEDINFIKFNYWDSGRKGLLSGEALYLDIQRMDMAYHEHNKREYEITKHISLQQLNPYALIQLKATGSCEVTIPEWVLDLDGRGQYCRRLKTAFFSFPCVVGPYTGINCTVSLLKSTIRKSPLLKDGEYARQGTEDDRFIDHYGTIQSVVISNAIEANGLFETNLKDEHYLPFEGAGLVDSTWKLQLQEDFRQFDYNTISDVVFRFLFTAREGGSQLRSKSTERINQIVEDANAAGLALSFSLKHNFPMEWHKFVSSTDIQNDSLKIAIKKEHFPYIVKSFRIKANRIDLYAIKGDEGSAEGISVLSDSALESVTSSINDDGKAEIEIPYDAEILNGKKENEVMLIMSYSVER